MYFVTKTIIAALIQLCFILCATMGISFAATDFAGLSNGIALTAGVQSASTGYDTMSGTTSYSVPLVAGPLPFSMQYARTVRSREMDDNYQLQMGFEESAMADWFNSYSGQILFIANSATPNNKPLITVKLPGSRENYFFYIDSATQRLNRAYGLMLGGTAPIYHSENLKEFSSFTISGSSFNIVKDGIRYEANVYRPMATTETLSPGFQYTLVKFTKISYPNGKVISLGYDSDLNLISVVDNRNNSLTFDRNYKKAGASTQTALERKLITGVTARSGTNQHMAGISYNEVQTTALDNPALTETRYVVKSINSHLSGKLTFGYDSQPRGSWYKLLQSKVANSNKLPSSIANYPILNVVSDASGNILRQWVYTVSFDYNPAARLFNSFTASISSFAPSSNVKTLESITNYNDVTGTISTKFTTNGNVQQLDYNMSSQITTPSDYKDLNSMKNQSSSVEVVGTYPGMYSGKVPVRKYYVNPYIKKVTSIIDYAGNTTSYEYNDNLDRLTKVTEAVGKPEQRITTYAYTTLSNGSSNIYAVPNVIQRAYQKTTNVLSPAGWITRQTASSTQAGSIDKVVTYSYNSNAASKNYGLLLWVDGARTGTVDKVSYTYDNYGNKATESQLVNGIVRSTQYVNYNSFGKPARIVYPNGLADGFVYNGDGTLKNQTHGTLSGSIVSGQLTSYTYNPQKQVLTTTNADNEVTAYSYDNLGRLVQVTAPDGSMSKKTYHSNNVVQSEELRDRSGAAIFNASYQTLDTNGRVAKVQSGTAENLYSVSNTYDVNGNLTATTTSEGIVNSWTYDAYNRVKTHTNGLGKTDTKTYDLMDNVILAKDALLAGSDPLTYRNGNVLTQEVNSDFGTKSYTYDEADNLTGSTYGLRQCDYLSIDALGRNGQVNCKRSSGATAASSIYDDVYAYDQGRFGRLNSISSNSAYGVNTVYEYDTYDRITEKKQTNQSLGQWGLPQSSLRVGYSYSTGGKLEVLTLPSQRQVVYSYNSGNTGKLTGVSLNASSLISRVSYDAGGQITGWNWGNTSAGYEVEYDSSNNGAIKRVINKTSSGTANYAATYGFDRDGRIVKIIRHNGVDNFSYDHANRLLTENRASRGGVNIYGIAYTYDANGNRLSLTATGSHEQPAALVRYGYSGNKLTTLQENGVSQSVSYTANAEMVLSDHSPGYDYGGRRNFETPLDTNNQRYMVYNHLNQRTIKTRRGGGWGSNLVQYVYDESNHLIGEYNNAGVPLVEYVWLVDKPVAAIYGSGASAKVYYIVTDAQNTPRRLIDSINSAIVWSWDSTAFGMGSPTGSVTFNLRFPGQYYDVDSKQMYNLNRYYNPELGRYMEPDPIGLEGGLNPYAYAGNSPVMNVDPSVLALVNVWRQQGVFGTNNFQWGHVSMLLNNVTYISRWLDRGAGGSSLKDNGPLSSIFTAPTMQG